LDFLVLFDQFDFHVGLEDLKMILADFWALRNLLTVFLDTE